MKTKIRQKTVSILRRLILRLDSNSLTVNNYIREDLKVIKLQTEEIVDNRFIYHDKDDVVRDLIRQLARDLTPYVHIELDSLDFKRNVTRIKASIKVVSK